MASLRSAVDRALGEESHVPLAEAKSAGVRYPEQLVDCMLRLYVPSRRVFLIEAMRLLAQVFVVGCQVEGLLRDGLSGECLCHLFQTEVHGCRLGVYHGPPCLLHERSVMEFTRLTRR